MKHTFHGQNAPAVKVFDIGGTNVKYSFFNKKGQIIEKNVLKTPRKYDELIFTINSLIEKNDKVVLGLPAVIDCFEQKIIYSPNLKYLTGKRITKDIVAKNILIENDANLAALGEYHSHWKSKPNMLMVTLGTGVGGGLILNGKLARSSYSVAEIGHIIIEDGGRKCGCGNYGCLEAYCGKNGIIKTYYELSKENVSSVNKIYNHAINGKLTAKLTFKQFAHYLAIGLVSAINVVFVNNIILGGGISHFHDVFFKDLISFFSAKIYPPYKKNVIINIARLKNDAALIGGFYYAKENNFITDNNNV